MKSFKIIMLGTLSLFSGCVSLDPKTIVGPDGTPHLLVNCYTMESCYAKATETCGGKYKIVNTTSDTTSFGDNSPTTTSYQLLIKCQK